ncbi:MAG TPA: hypothetical protein DEH78_01840 [Solibacterales bacterium]|nr:hypothetical protein [Bryobacterales bacterium]
MNRRDFLAAGAAVAPLFVPRSAFGANDRPAFGTIATGSRGRYLNSAFQKLGAQCVALCDVYQPYLEEAKKTSPAGVKAVVDYRDLLATKGLDFVVVASPDHHHRPMLLDALKAGLDVYTEKPLSLNLEESRIMVEAAKKSKQIVQVGMQRRSTPFIREARQFIADGGLGKISMVEAFWNWHFTMPLSNDPLPGELDWPRFLGPAPKRPLEPRRFRWWRGFWDYSGGNTTDQGTHLMDVVQWMTNSGPPLTATCIGRVVEAEGAEAPNVFTAAFEYPEFIATWTLNYRSTYRNDWWIVFRGEKATLTLNRKGSQLYPDPGPSPAPWSVEENEKPAQEKRDPFIAEPHMQNFLDCIKTRQQPNCPPEVAAASVAGPHLANIAYRESRKVKLGPDGRAA